MIYFICLFFYYVLSLLFYTFTMVYYHFFILFSLLFHSSFTPFSTLTSSAFEALANTHLYGRHLVFEFAQDDTSIEQVREKTTRHYVAESAGKASRKRVRMEDHEDEDSMTI